MLVDLPVSEKKISSTKLFKGFLKKNAGRKKYKTRKMQLFGYILLENRIAIFKSADVFS